MRWPWSEALFRKSATIVGADTPDHDDESAVPWTVSLIATRCALDDVAGPRYEIEGAAL